MAKITGKEGLNFKGKARTFDSEDDFVKAVESGSIKKGEKTVVILRYLGPQGGPGMCSVPSDVISIQTNPPFPVISLDVPLCYSCFLLWLIFINLTRILCFNRLCSLLCCVMHYSPRGLSNGTSVFHHRSRYAGDAQTYKFDNGCRFGFRCCVLDRW